MVAAAEALLPKLRTTMDAHAFHEGLEAIWTVIRAANVYVDRQAPWTLRKTDEARMRTVLYTLAETIRNLALLTQPFMPTASGAILDQLAVAEASRRSDERRVGQACVHPCRLWWSPYHYKKK